MTTPSPTSPPKRPRLSLQIRAIANGPTGRTSRTLAAAVDVKSPTSFNTLSNVYATAVDRSTPVQEKAPQTALNSRPSLRLQTQASTASSAVTSKERRLQTPYLGPYLDTPVTAQPMSPANAIPKQVYFPSAAMTATPPMSAQPPDQEGARVFTFENQAGVTPVTTSASSSSSRAPQSATAGPRRAKTLPSANNLLKPPYTHPRSLRSILRNSPLPPLSTTKSPDSPRRQSLRLQEKAARRVAYNSPLEQTITTSKYTKSHIDLLADDATPTTPSASSDGEDLLDATMAYTGNETRDGGQTPGPFEEMRRRMAGLRASTPVGTHSSGSSPTSAGIRKRGRGGKKEKKRRWVWTIGQDGEDADEMGSPVDPMDRSPAAKKVAAAAAVAAAANAPVMNVGALPVVSVSSVPVIAVPLPKPRTRMQAALQQAVSAATASAAASSVQLAPTIPAPAPAPVLAIPSASATAVVAPPAAPPIQQQEQQQQPQQQLPEEAAPLTAVLSSTSTSASADISYSIPRITICTTPEPQTAILQHQHDDDDDQQQQQEQGHHHHHQSSTEPPTPSLSVTSTSTATTTQESLFESAEIQSTDGGEEADVEMSDASSVNSMFSDCGGDQYTVTPFPGAAKLDTYMGGIGMSMNRGMDVDGDMDMDSVTPTVMSSSSSSSGFGQVHGLGLSMGMGMSMGSNQEVGMIQ